MQIKFQAAKLLTDQDGSWLCLKAPLYLINQVIQSIQPDKHYTLEAKEQRKQRSKDANSYLWVLIGKLSAVLKLPPQEVYRRCIHDIGGNYTVLQIRNDAVDEWCNKIWPGKGLGWITDNLGPLPNPRIYKHRVLSRIVCLRHTDDGTLD